MLNNNRVAIITGITKGIGKAIALSFAQEGISLVGVARNKSEIKDTCEEISQKYKVHCLGISADVSKDEEVCNMVNEAIVKFNRIDILVNNTGVGAFDFIVDSRLEDWERIIDVNLRGVYLCSKAALSQMMKQKTGEIVNISSVSGLKGYSKCGAYCASKFGVIGFTEVLAQEAAPYNIKVFAVCPDRVDTTFANNINLALPDKSNMLKPEDVAKAVLSLIKSESKSQICEIRLRPLNIFDRIIRTKQRKTLVKRIRFI